MLGFRACKGPHGAEFPTEIQVDKGKIKEFTTALASHGFKCGNTMGQFVAMLDQPIRGGVVCLTVLMCGSGVASVLLGMSQ